MMPKSANSLEGCFLVAMPHMGDQRFADSIILVCAHSDEGAMGFIVNRPAERPSPMEFWERLGVVTEQDKDRMPEAVEKAKLYTGGPVEPGRGFVLHSSDYSSDTTMQVNDEVSLTATLEILRDLVTGRGPEQFMVALGYSGWSSGQLEEEIASNGWLVCPADREIIFGEDDGGKYQDTMRSMGIDPALMSTDSGHA